MKKNNKNISKKIDKVFNLMKYVICFLCIVFLIELIWFLVVYFSNKKNVYIDNGQKIITTESGYLTVGTTSDGDNTKHNGFIRFFNNDDELTNQYIYKKNKKSMFYDAIKVKDGYIIVGNIINKKNKNGLIIKLDNNGKVIYEYVNEEYQISSYKTLVVDNNKILVGGYAYDSKNNNTGSLISTYNLKGKLLTNNIIVDGKYSIINKIKSINNKYYISGSYSSSVSYIMQLDENLKQKNIIKYNDTNGLGFLDFVIVDNNIYGVCVKTSDDDKRKVTKEQATIVKYDINGNIIKEITDSKYDFSSWMEIENKDNSLYLVGNTAVKKGKKGSIYVKYIYDGLIGKYDVDLNKVWQKEYSFNNNDYYKSLIMSENGIKVLGYSNSSNNDLGSKKHKYKCFIDNYDFEGNKKTSR